MNPTKNRVFCNNCHRVKMVFQTQEKAENFVSIAGNITKKRNYIILADDFAVEKVNNLKF